jgi:hypothetical protein
MPDKKKAEKPKGFFERVVRGIQNTGAGGTIQARPGALDDRIAEAEGDTSRRRKNQSTDSNN